MLNAKQAGVLDLAAALLWLSPATVQQQEHHWQFSDVAGNRIAWS